jgi:hypothetical protein
MSAQTQRDETKKSTVILAASPPEGPDHFVSDGSARAVVGRDPAISGWFPPVSDNRPARVMRLSKSFIDFNKQILFGEIGAVVGIQLAPLVTSCFTADPSIISLAAVLGGPLAGSVLWLMVKSHDEKRRGANSVLNLAVQIAFFSPAAFIIGLIVYQPTLFLVARHMLKSGNLVVYSVLISQFAAFAFFLVAINIYRLVLYRIAGKRI